MKALPVVNARAGQTNGRHRIGILRKRTGRSETAPQAEGIGLKKRKYVVATIPRYAALTMPSAYSLATLAFFSANQPPCLLGAVLWLQVGNSVGIDTVNCCPSINCQFSRHPRCAKKLFNPTHHQLNHKTDSIICQRPSFFNPVPFPQTSPATCGGSMLGNEYWMSFHRRLFAIIFGEGWCQSGSDEINDV